MAQNFKKAQVLGYFNACIFIVHAFGPYPNLNIIKLLD